MEPILIGADPKAGVIIDSRAGAPNSPASRAIMRSALMRASIRTLTGSRLVYPRASCRWLPQ